MFEHEQSVHVEGMFRYHTLRILPYNSCLESTKSLFITFVVENVAQPQKYACIRLRAHAGNADKTGTRNQLPVDDNFVQKISFFYSLNEDRI